MTGLQYAINRLKAWIRDFGHEKQPQFIEDLECVLAALIPPPEVPQAEPAPTATLDRQRVVEALSGDILIPRGPNADEIAFAVIDAIAKRLGITLDELEKP